MTPPSQRLHLSVAASADGASCALSDKAPEEVESATRMRVGDLAKLTRVTVRTLHHYEELGLIEPVARSKGHYRLYEQESASRVRWIGKLKDLGLSLSEVRQLVRRRQQAGSAIRAADELQQTYRDKLADVRERLSRLSTLETELEESLRYLEECDSGCTPDTAPTDCAQCERHSDALDNDLINGALV